MVVGRELTRALETRGTLCVFHMQSVLLFYSPCQITTSNNEVSLPSFCRWRNKSPVRVSQGIVRAGEESKPHLSDIKARVLSYPCVADTRWSVSFSRGPANSLSRTHSTPGRLREIFWQRSPCFGVVSKAKIPCVPGDRKGLQLLSKPGSLSVLVYEVGNASCNAT